MSEVSNDYSYSTRQELDINRCSTMKGKNKSNKEGIINNSE